MPHEVQRRRKFSTLPFSDGCDKEEITVISSNILCCRKGLDDFTSPSSLVYTSCNYCKSRCAFFSGKLPGISQRKRDSQPGFSLRCPRETPNCLLPIHCWFLVLIRSPKCGRAFAPLVVGRKKRREIEKDPRKRGSQFLS